MTFPVWLEVVCGYCSTTTAGRFTYKGNIPVRQIKNEAKANGWVFKYNDCFCSEYCADKHFERIDNE